MRECMGVCFFENSFFPVNEQLASANTLQECLYVRVTIKNTNIYSLLDVSAGEKMRLEFNAGADKTSNTEPPLVSEKQTFPANTLNFVQ